MVADILFDKAMAVMATDHRIGQIDILDDGLKFAFVLFGNLTAKDDGNFVGLADGAIGIQQPGSELIERRAAMKNQIVTVFDLGKEKTVSATDGLAFALLKEWGKRAQPFLPTAKQIVDRQGISQLLKPLGLTAAQKRIGTLFKIDAFFTHAVG
jgi:hypothetical protein